MALSKSDFYTALQPLIKKAFADMQRKALSMQDPGEGPQLILELSQDLAKAITDQVDTFVRSASIKPEMMHVGANTIPTVGDATAQNGPQSDAALKKESLKIDDMN